MNRLLHEVDSLLNRYTTNRQNKTDKPRRYYMLRSRISKESLKRENLHREKPQCILFQAVIKRSLWIYRRLIVSPKLIIGVNDESPMPF